MKSTKLLLCGIALATIAGLGTMKADAATYPDATHATSNGKITFTDDGTNIIPDPEKPVDPINPVDPTDPTKPDDGNKNPGDLKLVVVPDLDFGSHQKTAAAFTAQAKSVAAFKDGNKVYRAPWVTTHDMRTDRGTGWTLSVTSGEFALSTDATKKANGAEIVFTNANYADPDAGVPAISSKASQATLAGGLALTPGTEVSVANASTATNQGVGDYSLALGTPSNTTADGTTNGVTFRMPAKTAVETGTYQTTLNWELKPTLSAL